MAIFFDFAILLQVPKSNIRSSETRPEDVRQLCTTFENGGNAPRLDAGYEASPGATRKTLLFPGVQLGKIVWKQTMEL